MSSDGGQRTRQDDDEIKKRREAQNKIRCQRYRDKKKRETDKTVRSRISKEPRSIVEQQEAITRRREYNKQKSQRYRDKKRASNLTRLLAVQSFGTVVRVNKKRNSQNTRARRYRDAHKDEINKRRRDNYRKKQNSQAIASTKDKIESAPRDKDPSTRKSHSRHVHRVSSQTHREDITRRLRESRKCKQNVKNNKIHLNCSSIYGTEETTPGFDIGPLRETQRATPSRIRHTDAERKVHHSGIVAASENVTTPECVLTEQIVTPAAAGRRAAPRDPRPGAAAAGDRENIFKVKVKNSINNQIESQGSQDYNDGEVKKPTEVIYNKQEYLIGTHYHCKECNADIVGFRYTCVECADYHVCAACEACEAHAHHYVLRVPADKPHDEAMAMVERIRQLIDIREQDNPETHIGEIESFKSEIDIDEDPLEGAYKVKIEPEETDVLEAAPQTDHQDTFPSHVTTIKEYAQTAEPKASKRKKCSDALADMPPVTRPQLDTQSRTSIDRASEVSSKRSKTKKESAPISSSSNINKQTHKTCAVQSTVPNLYVPGTSDPALGSAGPILRYDIQNPASNQRSPPELLYSPPTRSVQAQLRPCDLTQPIEEFFIKTEFPD